MLLALIANPRSRTAPDPSELERLLGADGARVARVAIDDVSAAAGVADGALAALTAAGTPDRVVVAGGDGSVGPAALCAARLGVPLAVVAVGTANDFARAKGLPLELDAACALARDRAARSARAELGLAAGRPFVNVAAAGLAVRAARAAAPHKPRLGPLAYALGSLHAGLRARPLRCVVRVDGEQRYAGAAWQVVVAVTGAFGGGSEIGGTSPRDGLLDVAVVPAGPRLGLVRRALAMRLGRLTEQADVPHERGATIDIGLDESPRFNVDGEQCRCQPARFELHPGGFAVVTGS